MKDSFQSALLNQLLQEELSLGNSIQEEGPGWGKCVRLVKLTHPFRTTVIPHQLQLREINDPHYWKAEIEDPDMLEMLVCGFDY